MIRIVISEWDGTKASSHEVDVTLQCACGGRSFEQTYTGYAWNTAVMHIGDEPDDVSFDEGETEVGDDWETDWEFRCQACYEYQDTKTNEALKVYKRYQEASAEDALKAYIDQVLFSPLTDEKKELLDQLKGGFINLHEKRAVEASEGPCAICMEDGRSICIH